jgi:hypothetical protein
MPDRPELPPLDDLLGREVEYEGHRWTIRYDSRERRLVLQRPGPEITHDQFLAALRSGALLPALDTVLTDRDPLPTDPERRSHERRMLEATLEGLAKIPNTDPEIARRIELGWLRCGRRTTPGGRSVRYRHGSRASAIIPTASAIRRGSWQRRKRLKPSSGYCSRFARHGVG